MNLRWEQKALMAIIWGISASVLPIACSVHMAKAQGAIYPSDIQSWLLALAPFLSLALVVGAVAALVGKLWQGKFWKGSVWVFGTAALGIVAERLTFFLPLPLNLAVTQTNLQILVLPIASFAGVWGLSWFVWFVAAAIAEIASSRRMNFVTTGTIIAVLSLSILSFPLVSKVNGHNLFAAAIQNESEDPLKMLQAALKSREKGLPSLIVLPELSLGQETPLMWRQLKQVVDDAKIRNAFIVAGLEESNPSHNSAVLINSDGQEILRYRKVHLFGTEGWRYIKGREVKAADWLGIAICFDTVFPDVVHKLARQGAKVIAVPNHDPVAVGFLLHHLHASFFTIRAAENGVSIVKADTMGLSQLINCDGSVVAEAPLGKPVVLKGRVTIRTFSQANYQTLYTRLGDWFLVLCAIIAVSLFLARFFGEGKRIRAIPQQPRAEVSL